MLIMNIKIDKISNKDIPNIKVLKTRQKGDLYYCDNSGFLKKMSLYQKIFYVLSKIFSTAYYKDIQFQLNILISDLISRIDSDDKKELTDLFFQKLSTLSENIYDRSKINPKILSVLGTSLEKDFDYQLLCAKQRSCQRKFLGFSYIPEGEKRKFENTKCMKKVVLDALLATNLGVRATKPNSGNSQSYFIRDINKNIIGIFKPAEGNSLSLDAPFAPIRWRNKIFIKIDFGGSLFKHIANYCHVAEIASYEMDENIKTYVVPPTAIVNLNPERWNKNQKYQKGSLQVFVKDVVEAKKFLKVNKVYKPIKTFNKENMPQLADELFDKLVINDVISGNFDRHSENWLVQVDEKNPLKANNILLIDGGMAFSPTHSTIFLERKKQYAWATTAFKWAQSRFTNQAKEIIKDVYRRRFMLRKELIKLYVDQGDEMEIAKNRGDRMIERIEMLHYVAIKKNMRKHKLINYRTQEEMKQFRETIN